MYPTSHHGRGGNPSAAERQKAAREQALQVNQAQDQALSELPLHTLYIVLHIRDDPPTPNNFHWGFYYHTTPRGGHKYHVKQIGGGWITDHAATAGVFKSNFLCVLIEIGTIPAAQTALLDQTMRAHDDSLNDLHGVTCRVWVLTILTELKEVGLVHFGNRDSVEEECFQFGNTHSYGAVENQQPRPVVTSTQCY